jgi:hypothetical protein
MAWEQQLRSISALASANLSASQFCFVVIDSNGNIALPAAGGDADGILQDNPNALGVAGTIGILGVSKVVVGSGGVAAGALVATDASGNAVTATTGNKILGRALQAGAQGDIIPVLIQQKSMAAPGPTFFKSAVLTGTGASQNVAHGLGNVPTGVLVSVYDNSGASADPFTVTEGVHTSTNVVLTVTANTKFKVIAWL